MGNVTKDHVHLYCIYASILMENDMNSFISRKEAFVMNPKKNQNMPTIPFVYMSGLAVL